MKLVIFLYLTILPFHILGQSIGEEKFKAFPHENKWEGYDEYSLRKELEDIESKIEKKLITLNALKDIENDLVYFNQYIEKIEKAISQTNRKDTIINFDENPDLKTLVSNYDKELDYYRDIFLRNNLSFNTFRKIDYIRYKDEEYTGRKLLEIVDEANTLSSNIIKVKNELEEELKGLKRDKKSIIQNLSKDLGINSLAIYLGLPLFCITILLLFLAPKILEAFGKKSTNHSKSDNQALLEVSTVLLLTMSILILGLAGNIKGEVLGTLLGGISAYVLNRTLTRKQNNP